MAAPIRRSLIREHFGFVSQTFTISRAVFAGVAATAVIVAFLPAPAGAQDGIMPAAAIIILAIGLWSTSVVPLYVGALVFLFAAMVAGIAPADVVFSGFHAGAMWLVFGGLVIGLAVRQVGVDKRLVNAILTRFPPHYLALLYGVALGAGSLAFVIPSASGRVALLTPIMMALAERLGFPADSKGRTGLVLMGTMGTMTPAFGVLPANVPNMTFYGAIESIYRIQIPYGEYLVTNFPVLGIGGIILYPLVIFTLFREQPKPAEIEEIGGVWSAPERRLTVILLLALALWITDTVHGVAPAWVALGAALVCLLPGVGMIPGKALGEINYTPLFFLAGVIGLGAVATHAGIGDAAAKQILPVLDLSPETPVRNFASMIGLGWVVAIFTTMPAAPSVLVPMADALAEASGWSRNGVLMTQVATWMIFPFPYQAPPVVVAMVLGDLRIAPIIKMLVTYMIVGVILLLPLHYLWGRWLGVFS